MSHFGERTVEDIDTAALLLLIKRLELYMFSSTSYVDDWQSNQDPSCYTAGKAALLKLKTSYRRADWEASPTRTLQSEIVWLQSAVQEQAAVTWYAIHLVQLIEVLDDCITLLHGSHTQAWRFKSFQSGEVCLDNRKSFRNLVDFVNIFVITCFVNRETILRF